MSDGIRRDVLSDMEQVLGKDHHDFTEEEMGLSTLLHIAHNQEVNATFKAMHDTYFNMSWAEFKTLISNYGFETVLLDTYTYQQFPDDSVHMEEFLVAYLRDKGLLLTARSFTWTCSGQVDLSGGTIYGEVQFKRSEWREVNKILGSYSGGVVSPEGDDMTHIQVNYDVREGLLSTIERIHLSGTVSFCQKWTKLNRRRHIWLVDYQQEHESENHRDKYDDGGYFDRCRDERAARLPADIREAIGY